MIKTIQIEYNAQKEVVCLLGWFSTFDIECFGLEAIKKCREIIFSPNIDNTV